jgi:hypothetical protein
MKHALRPFTIGARAKSSAYALEFVAHGPGLSPWQVRRQLAAHQGNAHATVKVQQYK